MMELQKYRWPNLSSVIRQFVVRDDRGRHGIAVLDPIRHEDVLFVHPVDLPEITNAGTIPGTETLPCNAIVSTSTTWHWDPDKSAYTGVWCDYRGLGLIPDKDIRTLTIVADLGWEMPDRWADEALAGSDQMGYWDYGARLGRVGGEPPIKGMSPDEMTVRQTVQYCREVGAIVSERGLRKAARSGYIPGARRIGRDWLITYTGINHYLDNRPRPGRKK